MECVNPQKDPFLDLVDDNRLKVVAASSVNLKDYGSATDDHEALRSLSCISFAHNQTSEALVALIVHSGAPISDVSYPSPTEFIIVLVVHIYNCSLNLLLILNSQFSILNIETDIFFWQSEGSSADQMLQPFCADDVQGLVPHLYLEAPHKSGFGSGESTSFEEVHLAFGFFLLDEVLEI